MKAILKKFQPAQTVGGWTILYPNHFCLFFSSEEEANKIARAMTLAYRAGKKAK